MAIEADHAAGRCCPSPSSRRSARRRRRPSTRSPRSPTSPRARACGCTSTPRTPAPSRCIPERRAPFAGWERADSIVVNPHKWLFTPLDASLLLTRRMDQPAGRVQPRARVPAHARPRHAGPRLQRVQPAARAPVPRAQAVDAAALVRARGAAAPDRCAPGAGRAVRGLGRRGSATGSGWRRCRSRRSASGAPAGWPRRVDEGDVLDARRPQRAVDGRRQPHRRGVPVAHAAARPVHDPARRSATCGPSRAPRRTGVGAAARRGRRLAAETPMAEAFTTRGSDA